jgi:hypothetical protein
MIRDLFDYHYKKDIHGIQSSKASQGGTFSWGSLCTEHIPCWSEAKDNEQLWYWWLTAERESALIITERDAILLNDVFFQRSR